MTSYVVDSLYLWAVGASRRRRDSLSRTSSAKSELAQAKCGREKLSGKLGSKDSCMSPVDASVLYVSRPTRTTHIARMM